MITGTLYPAGEHQAILEDHCSRIWAASADRTPNSSSSSGGGGGGGSGVGVGDPAIVGTENATDDLPIGQDSDDSFSRLTHQPVQTEAGSFDAALRGIYPSHATRGLSRFPETGNLNRGTGALGQDSEAVRGSARLDPSSLPETGPVVPPVTR